MDVWRKRTLELALTSLSSHLGPSAMLYEARLQLQSPQPGAATGGPSSAPQSPIQQFVGTPLVLDASVKSQGYDSVSGSWLSRCPLVVCTSRRRHSRLNRAKINSREKGEKGENSPLPSSRRY